MRIEEADAAFLQGKKGRTRMKLENCSGAKLWIDENDLSMKGRGTPEQVKMAKKYCECLVQQRAGPVKVDDSLGTLF